jgi:hypothetical protein
MELSNMKCKILEELFKFNDEGYIDEIYELEDRIKEILNKKRELENVIERQKERIEKMKTLYNKLYDETKAYWPKGKGYSKSVVFLE